MVNSQRSISEPAVSRSSADFYVILQLQVLWATALLFWFTFTSLIGDSVLIWKIYCTIPVHINSKHAKFETTKSRIFHLVKEKVGNVKGQYILYPFFPKAVCTDNCLSEFLKVDNQFNSAHFHVCPKVDKSQRTVGVHCAECGWIYETVFSIFFFRVDEFIVMIITAIVPHGMNIGRCITQWYPKWWCPEDIGIQPTLSKVWHC